MTSDEEQSTSTPNSKKIAIIGMSCLFPGAPDLASFWQNIVSASDCIREATDAEWRPSKFYNQNPSSFEQIYCKRGGYITDLTDFDPLKMGVMPNSLAGSDPDQWLSLRVAAEALADAGYEGRIDPDNRYEVILGRTMAPGAGSMNMIHRGQTIQQVMDILLDVNPEMSAEQRSLIEEGLKSSLKQVSSDNIPAVMPNVLAGRIAGRLHFNGRSIVLDSACASSLIAVEIAVRDLQSGQCDLALAGGVHVNSCEVFQQMFCGLGALSKEEVIRPFDQKADGTILGEGLGMVVLKRFEDAVRDGDRIYAVICGIGSSSDGQGTSMLAPSPDGEALALRKAYDMAQVSPRTVSLLEAHGTGTPSGDVVEMQAVEKVFGQAEENDAAWCAIGSVKSMIGHTQAASGVAGLIKTALSLYHRVLPPTLNVDKPTGEVDWQKSSCYINTQTRPWIHAKVHPQVAEMAREHLESEENSVPRRAAVSAFGFGGVNAHAVLEEYDDHLEAERPSLQQTWPSELCLFVGTNIQELTSHLQLVSDSIQRNQISTLRDIAFSLAKQTESAELGFKSNSKSQNPARLSIVAYSVPDLQTKIADILSAFADGQTEINLRDIYFVNGGTTDSARGKVAFVLPGLGAAYPNMLAELCLQFPDVRAVFDYVDQLAQGSGTEPAPSGKIFPRPFKPVTENAASLAAMDSAVVTVLMAEWALFTVLQKLGITPDALLGCSTGEFAALVMSGAVDILTAAPMFYRLSTNVSRSVPREKLAQLKSAMVLADYELMKDALSKIDELYLGAALSPTQTILSGSPEGIAAAMKAVEELELAATVLPTAIPYHTPLVSGFIHHENDELQQLPLQAPITPAWSCSQVRPYPDDVAEMRRITTELFTQPIMLKKTVEAMYADGITTFVEVGPKGVLTPLIQDILSDMPHIAVASNVSQTSAITQLNQCLAELASHGIPMQLDYLFARRAPKLIDFKADQPKPKRTVKLNLTYPIISLPPETSAKVRALRPIQQSPVPAEGTLSGTEASLTQDSSQPQSATAPGDVILESYLTGMQQFHQNLMGMQEHVMRSYLDQTDIEDPSEEPLPLLRTNLISSQIDDNRADADLMLTLDTHRYLLDHAIGGDVTKFGISPERVYLMPLTVALELMAELATTLIPEQAVVRINEVRAVKRIRVDWSGCRVRVSANRDKNDSIKVYIEVADANGATGGEQFASMQCRVHFAPEYAPAPIFCLPTDGQSPPRLREHELYTSDAMFHGPRMQSVLALNSTGKKLTHATVVARPAADWLPGIDAPRFVLDPLLLDNSTQPVLFHLYENNENVTALLPFLVESLDVYTDLSLLRGTLTVYASMLSSTSRGTEADVYICDANNNIVAKFTSISSRRISLSPEWKALVASPDQTQIAWPVPVVRDLLGEQNCGTAYVGSQVLPEDETTLSWLLDYILHVSEQPTYHALNTFQRKREWLSGRLALKEAVRRLVLQSGLQLCHADVVVEVDQSGRPFVSGNWLANLSFKPEVSLSHKDNIAIAVATPKELFGTIGVDIEPISSKEEGFERLAFTDSELQQLNSFDQSLRAQRSTQLWCAKESAGKALGTGLSNNPKSLFGTFISTDDKHAVIRVQNANGEFTATAHCFVSEDTVLSLSLTQSPVIATATSERR